VYCCGCSFSFDSLSPKLRMLQCCAFWLAGWLASSCHCHCHCPPAHEILPHLRSYHIRLPAYSTCITGYDYLAISAIQGICRSLLRCWLIVAGCWWLLQCCNVAAVSVAVAASLFSASNGSAGKLNCTYLPVRQCTKTLSHLHAGNSCFSLKGPRQR